LSNWELVILVEIMFNNVKTKKYIFQCFKVTVHKKPTKSQESAKRYEVAV
jgi:hypothetical protein